MLSCFWVPTMFMEIDKRDELSGEEKQKTKQDAEHHFQNTGNVSTASSQLLRAYSLYEKDKEYVVQNGKVNIVDQNTGRVMPGRRWSDGLHQAIEAKKIVQLKRQNLCFGYDPKLFPYV